MKSLTFFIIVWLSVCDASVRHQPARPDASNGICVSTNPNIGTMSYGESKDIARPCVRATCFQRGSIYFQECDPVIVPPGCRLTQGYRNAPFPKCCKSYVCNNQKH